MPLAGAGWDPGGRHLCVTRKGQCSLGGLLEDEGAASSQRGAWTWELTREGKQVPSHDSWRHYETSACSAQPGAQALGQAPSSWGALRWGWGLHAGAPGFWTLTLATRHRGAQHTHQDRDSRHTAQSTHIPQRDGRMDAHTDLAELGTGERGPTLGPSLENKGHAAGSPPFQHPSPTHPQMSTARRNPFPCPGQAWALGTGTGRFIGGHCLLRDYSQPDLQDQRAHLPSTHR